MNNEIKTWKKRLVGAEMNGETAYNAMRSEIAELRAKVESLAADAERLDFLIRHAAYRDVFLWIDQKSHFVDPRGRVAGIGDDPRKALDAAMAKEKA